jgi:pyruvate-formate lyase-activating enzyme
MSNDPILQKHLKTIKSTKGSTYDYSVLDYEGYAREKAIDFKEWASDRYRTYSGHDEWIELETRKLFSTEQLFEEYLKQRP